MAYRFVKPARLDKTSEGCRNSLHADLVKREAHDAVELADDERQSEALGVFDLMKTSQNNTKNNK